MRVEYISYGIGHRIDDTIYLNKDLKNDKELHDAILKHEQGHTEGFELKDLIHDINNKELQGLKRKYYWFIITHPKSLLSFSPILKVKGELAVDITLTIFYLFVFVMLLFMQIILN